VCASRADRPPPKTTAFLPRALTKISSFFYLILPHRSPESRPDIILFNPPYVVTPDSEVGTADIAASWAGGADGRLVIDRALPQIVAVMKETTVGYMVLVDDNKVEEVIEWLDERGVASFVRGRRKARNEFLNILRFERKKVKAEAEVPEKEDQSQH